MATPAPRPERLHLVVRADLSAAQVAVQAAHAARAFAHQHPEVERAWFEASNHLALLAVPDEATLERLSQRAFCGDVAFAAFREPDLGGSLTAIAVEPGPRGQAICRRLPLALPEADR